MIDIKKLNDSKIFVFDLDRTIWATRDKYGNLIWAKQMLEPFIYDAKEEVITDEVGNETFLFKGIKNYLQSLKAKDCYTTFLSLGKIYNNNNYNILNLISEFELQFNSNSHGFLAHKSDSNYKNYILSKLSLTRGNLIYFNDDEKENEFLSSIEGVTIIKPTDFKENYNNLIYNG